jgi:TolB-like protein/Flp pilus assembly protein TadD
VTAVDPSLAAALRDRYVLERELGRGGMATVYLAQDLRHDRPVALKVLHPELAHALGPERFLQEIKLAARLQHPHILGVLDSGEASTGESGGGRLWFTMPYVDGESLRDRLRRERQLPLEDALRITTEVALALDFAHRHGVIHRDVKPENILLCDGQALVADFGIGRALGMSAPGEGLTETGVVVGTPAYMAPEQAAGERTLDGRTDIYSLGVVLYELLAGEPPHTGPTMQAVLARRFSGELPRVRQFRPSVPEQIEQALQKALALVPADRFATAAAFARALSGGTGTATAVSTTAAAPPRAAGTTGTRAHRRPPLAAVTLGLGILIGLGVLFAWRRGHPGDTRGDAGPRRLAVLPFENMGQPDDEYFADGVTDAIRGKLAALPGFQVTASNSSGQYKRTTKSPRQIGQELGVEYLLVGKVRWQKGQGGQSRIEVSPELVQVSTASTKWQEPFHAALSDVFREQAEIAARVAKALDVTLGSGAREELGTKPTENLAAYSLYLRGNDYYDRGYAREDFRIAQQMYQRAVALDPTFAQAYAKLCYVYASEYWFFYERTDETLAKAKASADEALRLQPELPDAHLALGYYYYWGKLEYDAALREFTAALKRQPNNADLIFAIGAVQRRQGKWAEAVAHFARAAELDPRSSLDRFNLGETYLLVRDYPRAVHAFDEAVGLAPDWANPYVAKAQALLSSGASLQQARQVMLAASEKVTFPALAAAVVGSGSVSNFATAPTFLLTTEPRYRKGIESLSLPAFTDSLGYYQLKAELYRHQRQPQLERSYLDSARAILEAELRVRPNEASFRGRLGLIYAYLGRSADAIREGEAAVTRLPISREAYGGANLAAVLALIDALTGRQDAAIDRLEYLLSIPSSLSRPLLRIDPVWEPLRGNPRFGRLVAGGK